MPPWPPLNTFLRAWSSVDQTERPLMRWAPHSALIRSHGTPQTFSVYDLKNVPNSSLPKRLMKNCSRVSSGLRGNSAL